MPFSLFESPTLTSTSTRLQILFTGIIGLGTFFLIMIPDLPFGQTFLYLALISGITHLLIFFFVKKLSRSIMSALFVFNTVLLGGVIHYTGGIISPFLFIFFCILVTASSQDLYPVFNLITTLVVFGLVVGAEYTGMIPTWSISTQEIYESGSATYLVGITIIGFMIISGLIYRVVLNNLRLQVDREQALKQNFLNQLTKLDASSQVGRLVNKIVHDVRGPLGAVSGFIKMFRTELALPDQAREDCDLILKELDRITRLINQMIKYTKPGTQRKEKLCPVDLMETVLSVISFHPAARGVEFKRRFVKSNSHWIRANKEELQQAYFNIIKNALEALEVNEDGRRIEVEIHNQLTDIVIEIKDNGPGIPPEILKNLLKDTISTKKEGAGVGLVIVKEILRGHGGDISISSTTGQGTHIRTQLPIFNSDSDLDFEKIPVNGGIS